MRSFVRSGLVCLALAATPPALGQIPVPDDAPPPLSAAESARRFKLPAGFRLELIASEPLVREPSGVCWDERGQLFVSELHGYNLEGQYDIEELNKTGQLDRVVRRIPAAEAAVQKAAAETYGTIKLLRDTDGDGRMDQADLWADRIPPCLGICSAQGGIIAACKTQILFLADRDGDRQAEVRDVLFEGFAPGPLERSIGDPQWGPDHWIYIGRGAGGGTIRGPHLPNPVQLPATDFRIRPDGSAIEPVVGGTHTLGFAFTEGGDRFVISTRTPGIFVAPISWRYLARNPDAAAPGLTESASSDPRVYPTSQPHPWRTRRADDPGFSKFYTDRYGIEEAAPNGYFTSACAPLVYQDVVLPGLRGQLLACEPAQNLLHRAVIQRDGSRLTLHRAPGEEQVEFLTSSDPWFHAIALSHAPDGSVVIVDFYREIIEDYSAIPRYLQQEYGVVNGRDRGRLWRLTHDRAAAAPPADLSRLTAAELAREVGGPHYWRRQTARRLLLERPSAEAAPILSQLARNGETTAAVINALHALDGLGALTADDVSAALGHADPTVRRAALQLSERWLNDDPALRDSVWSLVNDDEPLVRLQVALTVGECRQSEAIVLLADLAIKHGDERWLAHAVVTAVPKRGGELLQHLLRSPAGIGQATRLLEPLCAAIGNRRDPGELSAVLVQLAQAQRPAAQAACLQGLRSSFANRTSLPLDDAARIAVKALAFHTDAAVRKQAQPLLALWNLESTADRQARLALAARQLNDPQLDVDARLGAVAQLDADDDPGLTATLLAALSSATPRVREAILAAVCGRRDRLPPLLDALERGTTPPALLSAVQRAALLTAQDDEVRRRAAAVFAKPSGANDQLFARYTAALQQPRDAAQGERAFREKCGVCHQAHGLGQAVGPDLNAEFQRAEETIVRDVLAPSDAISAGYVTYAATTTAGQVFSGLLTAESPTSLTLRQAEAKEQVVLRKDVEELRALPVSLMPEDLVKTVAPQDLANILAWLRRPPTQLVLWDENVDLVAALNEGGGTAEPFHADRSSGLISLLVTPPQRYSAAISGWAYRIRERPAAGEFRYLRLSWKTTEADGVMLEIAADGHWPPAQQAARRYYAGKNTTAWQAKAIAHDPPREWTTVTIDLWGDAGDFQLTGIAPTAMGGPVLFDRIELLQQRDRPNR